MNLSALEAAAEIAMILGKNLSFQRNSLRTKLGSSKMSLCIFAKEVFIWGRAKQFPD